MKIDFKQKWKFLFLSKRLVYFNEAQIPEPEAQSETLPKGPREKIKTPEQKMRESLHKLEHSVIAPELKELMDVWLQKHLEGDAQEAYIDRIKERLRKDGAGSIKIAELAEGMADIYLSQHPDINTKFHNGDITMADLAEGIFDELFSWALVQNNTPERKQKKTEIELLLKRFKEVLKS